jgi:hydrophobic/amphiphilic exporter-1 (mainly G- bacteria), HAE1 family
MIRASIKRPVGVTMLYLVLTALGFVAWQKIPIELLPNTTLPRLTVTARWPGASAEALEAFVTSPLEGEIQQIKGVETVNSNSTANGQAQVNVTFARNTDMEFTRLELSERLAALARDRFPRGAERPTITPYIPEALADQQSEFLRYKVTGPYQLEALVEHVQEVIQPAIQAVDGVAGVNIQGQALRQIVLVMDEPKITALGLTPAQISQAIREIEFWREVGSVQDGDLVRTVTIRQRADSLIDLRRVILLSDNGRIVRVSDVAEVYDTFREPTSYNRIDGFPALSFGVTREARTNTVAVADRVKARIDSLASRHPSGVRLILQTDESKAIKTQLTDLRNRSLLSALIIFCVLLLFLQSFRSAFIVFSTIAFSVLITLNLMYAVGYTLNVLSLMALAMGFGIVVDTAIVVLENIYRRWRLGEAPEYAAEHGSREVILAILAGTLTTIVVFIPFVYLQGELRIFYLPLAIIVGFSQIASLFVAFTFIPALAARLLRSGVAKRSDTVTAGVPPMDAVPVADDVEGGMYVQAPERKRPIYVRGYAGLLGVTLRFPWVSVLLVALMLGGSYYLFHKYVSRQMRWGSWASQRSQVSVNVRMPQGEELERTDEIARFFDYRLRRLEGVESFTTNVTARNASIVVTFPDSLEYTAVPQIVYDQIVAFGLSFAGPSLSVTTSGKSFNTGGGASMAGNQAINVYGYNYERVREIAEDVAARLADIPRVHDVDASSTSGWGGERAIELVVRVNRQKLAMHDITVQDVVQKVSAAVRGTIGTNMIRLAGEDLQLEAKLSGYESFDLLKLEQLLLRSATGEEVRLSDVATIEERRVLSSIVRENQRYQRTVRYEFRGPQKLADRMRKKVVDETLVPDGYSVIGENPFRFSRDEELQIYGVLAVSIFLIFMVTAALFESLRQPLCVLLTIPMALIGVFLLFFYVNASFTREAYIGVIMMGGIVVNNSILLIDRVNQVRQHGHLALEAAIVQGTLDRVRPILMTTVVTIMGLLPLVLFSESPDSNIWNALGFALIGGLTSSTLLVLSVTPALYFLFERRKEKRRLARLAARTQVRVVPAV